MPPPSSADGRRSGPSSSRVAEVIILSSDDEEEPPRAPATASGNPRRAAHPLPPTTVAVAASAQGPAQSPSVPFLVAPMQLPPAQIALSTSLAARLQFCHQHQHLCPDTLQCTVLRPDGRRCPMHFCAVALSGQYDQSVGHILLRDLDFDDGELHVATVDYKWTCPRCSGRCGCHACCCIRALQAGTAAPKRGPGRPRRDGRASQVRPGTSVSTDVLPPRPQAGAQTGRSAEWVFGRVSADPTRGPGWHKVIRTANSHMQVRQAPFNMTNQASRPPGAPNFAQHVSLQNGQTGPVSTQPDLPPPDTAAFPHVSRSHSREEGGRRELAVKRRTQIPSALSDLRVLSGEDSQAQRPITHLVAPPHTGLSGPSQQRTDAAPSAQPHISSLTAELDSHPSLAFQQAIARSVEQVSHAAAVSWLPPVRSHDSHLPQRPTSDIVAKEAEQQLTVVHPTVNAVPTDDQQQSKQSPVHREMRPPIIKPAKVESAKIDRISTSLPLLNILERIWIYETLVRFDVIDTPPDVLQKLDRLDDWTPNQVHLIFIGVVCFLAGIKSVLEDLTPGKDKYVDVVLALRRERTGLGSGDDAWVAAQRLCREGGLQIAALKETGRMQALPDTFNIELPDHEEEAKRFATKAEESVAFEVRRERLAEVAKASVQDRKLGAQSGDNSSGLRRPRAANTEAQARMQRLWKRDKRSEQRRRKRRARPGADDRSVAEEEDESSYVTSGSDDEGDEERSNTKKARSCSLSVSSEESIPLCSTRNVRRRTKVIKEEEEEEDELDSSLSDASERGISAEKGYEKRTERNGGLSATLDPSLLPAPQVQASDSPDSVIDVAHSVVDPVQVQTTPEERIAILSALLVLCLQTPKISEDISTAVKEIEEYRKANKEDYKKMQEDRAEEARQLMERREVKMREGKMVEWTAEAKEFKSDGKWADLSWNVEVHLYIDARKPRTGPLGSDGDGNEYWHLLEYNEQKPDDTQGHWAWSLLVLGTVSSISRVSGTIQQGGNRGPPGGSGARMSSPDGSNNSMTEDEGENRAFYSVSTSTEIKKLIAYLRYRCNVLDYDEFRTHNEAAKQGRLRHGVRTAAPAYRVSRAVSGTPIAVGETAELLELHWTERLLSEHTIRRQRVDALATRLQSYEDYYQWHED